MKQVKIPLELDWTLWTLIPLVLLVVNNFTEVSGRPFGVCIIFTEAIEDPDNFASNIPLLIFCPVLESTITIRGEFIYWFPPLVTVTTPIVFEFLIEITGDMYEIGCKVLSEGYSNPSSRILTSLALPMDVDIATIKASFPSIELDPTKIGIFLYPYPPETIFILSIGPLAVNDFVLYFNVLHSFWEYFNFSGFSVKVILKVVEPIPETL